MERRFSGALPQAEVRGEAQLWAFHTNGLSLPSSARSKDYLPCKASKYREGGTLVGTPKLRRKRRKTWLSLILLLRMLLAGPIWNTSSQKGRGHLPARCPACRLRDRAPRATRDSDPRPRGLKSSSVHVLCPRYSACWHLPPKISSVGSVRRGPALQLFWTALTSGASLKTLHGRHQWSRRSVKLLRTCKPSS